MSEQDKFIDDSSIVDEWITSFEVKRATSEEGLTKTFVEIRELDPIILRSVLERFGAEFNPEKENYDKLIQPTNKHRRPGMNAVWGEGFMDNFNRWTVRWADAFEASGKRLAELNRSGNRTSGMRHFLGELTAYAAGLISYEEYRERTDARLVNGFTYQRGLGKSPAHFLPDNKRYPGSIPPGFIKDTWEILKSGKLKDGIPDVAVY